MQNNYNQVQRQGEPRFMTGISVLLLYSLLAVIGVPQAAIDKVPDLRQYTNCCWCNTFMWVLKKLGIRLSPEDGEKLLELIVANKSRCTDIWVLQELFTKYIDCVEVHLYNADEKSPWGVLNFGIQAPLRIFLVMKSNHFTVGIDDEESMREWEALCRKRHVASSWVLIRRMEAEEERAKLHSQAETKAADPESASLEVARFQQEKDDAALAACLEEIQAEDKRIQAQIKADVEEARRLQAQDDAIIAREMKALELDASYARDLQREEDAKISLRLDATS